MSDEQRSPAGCIAGLNESAIHFAGQRQSTMRFELPPDNRNRPDAELLDDLRRVARELNGDSVRRDDYEKTGRFNPQTLVNRFGTWNAALLRAGLRVVKRQAIPEQELLDDLKRAAQLAGPGPLTQTLYDVHGAFSHEPVVRRFGSWSKALAAAGLDANHLPKEAVPEQLFSNLERVWEHVGRAPTRADMRPPVSLFGSSPYVRRNGGWRAALEAFVAAANEPPPNSTDDKSDRTQEGPTPNRAVHRTGRNVGWRLRFLALRRDRFRCRSCGAAAESTTLHVDHVVPWSRGGETVLENLQALCEKCNVGKGTEHAG